MNEDTRIWMPPVLSLLGTLIVVTFTAWLNTRSVHAMIAELRALRADTGELRLEMEKRLGEVKLEIATFRGEVKLDILRIENKLDHYAGEQATHSEEIERLKARGN